MNKIKFNKKFKPLFINNDRYYIITGGRASSKSYTVSTYILMLILVENNHTILYSRYTMTSAHLSIIPEFLDKIKLLGVEGQFEITKDTITCLSTGSKIIFKGIKTSSGDQTANLKSLAGVTTWILDEAEELQDEEIFNTINLSIRSKLRPNKIILIMNPSTKEHWIYKRFFILNGVNSGSNISKKNVTYIHTTYLDNINNLNPSFIDEVEQIKLNNIDKYNTIILGEWSDRHEGLIITNWKIGLFNPDELQTSFGQDYGFSIDPTTLVECAIDNSNKKIYVKEHLYKKGLTTSEIFDVNDRVCGSKLIVGDSAEPRLIEELRQRGNNIMEAKKGAGSISAGIAILQDYEIIVEENSRNIMKELSSYCYSNRKAQLYVDRDNHIIDAIRYCVFYQSLAGNGIYHIY